MDINEFFDSLKNHFTSSKPFVSYRKPKSTKIQALLDNNDTINRFENNSQSGFVFAPFFQWFNNVFFEFDSCAKINATFLAESKKAEIPGLTFSSAERKRYLDLVKTSVNEIKKGGLRKIVVSRREELEINNKNCFEVFKALLSNNPKAFVYLIYHPKVGTWLGASPETLFSLHGKNFKTMSLAGTKFEKYSEWTQKELEEQKYVTDYLKKNLEDKVIDLKVYDQETVSTGDLFHLKTVLKGRLNSNKSTILKLIDLLHPTPAVCGLPKSNAMDFIRNNENYDREYYTGFIGEINMDYAHERKSNIKNLENRAFFQKQKMTDLYVNIRCLKLENSRASIYVGGGITEQSNPESEWLETVNKTLTTKKALN